MFVATSNFSLPLPDGSARQVTTGELLEASEITDGSFDCLVRMGKLAPAPPEGEVVEQPEGSTEDDPGAVTTDSTNGLSASEPPAWQLASVGALEIPDPARAALTKAGLDTVADVLDYALANEGLTKISGIGEATEKLIEEAIAKLAPAK